MEASEQLEVNKLRRDVMIKLYLKRLARGNRWSSCEAVVTIVAPANYLLEMAIIRLAKSIYQMQFNKTVIAHSLIAVFSIPTRT